jgi:hypothetical protein
LLHFEVFVKVTVTTQLLDEFVWLLNLLIVFELVLDFQFFILAFSICLHSVVTIVITIQSYKLNIDLRNLECWFLLSFLCWSFVSSRVSCKHKIRLTFFRLSPLLLKRHFVHF